MSGTYVLGMGESGTSVVNGKITTTFPIGINDGGSTFAAVANLGGGAAVGSLFAALQGILMTLTFGTHAIEVLQVPPEGPVISTVTNVLVEPGGVNTFETLIPNYLNTSATSPADPPLLSTLRFELVTDPATGKLTPYIAITGDNLTADNGVLFPGLPGVKGTQVSDLFAIFHQGDAANDVRVNPDLALSVVDPSGSGTLYFKVPQSVALGGAEISVGRKQLIQTANAYGIGYQAVERVSVPALFEKQQGQFLVGASGPNAVVVNAATNQILATIPLLGSSSGFTNTREVALDPTNGVGYVTYRFDNRVGVFDLIALQQIDANPGTAAIDAIILPTGAQAFMAVAAPSGEYLYVSDEAQGKVYVVDTRGSSADYLKVVQTIDIPGILGGLRGLDITADGHTLFVAGAAASYNKPKLPLPVGASPGVFAINVNVADRPATGQPNTRKWHEVIWRTGTAEADWPGYEPYGVTASSDPNKVGFTSYQNDPKGFGAITITNADPTAFAATVKYGELTLGSAVDAFDVNNAKSVVFSDDLQYAFVVGFNRFQQDIPSRDPNMGIRPAAGGNIGVIQDPFGAPLLVAATRMAPLSFPDSVVVSGHGRFLSGAYQGIGGLFVYDLDVIEQTLSSGGGQLATKSLDDINPAVIVRASYFEISKDVFGSGGGSSGPIGIPGIRGLASLDYDQFLTLKTPIGPYSDGPSPGTLTRPQFTWESDASTTWTYKIYLSTYPAGQGLFPTDTPPGTPADKLINSDINYTRILNGVVVGSDKFYDLPEEYELTAGQTYYWGIVAIGADGTVQKRSASFKIEQPAVTTPFSSVTVINHGFSLPYVDSAVGIDYIDTAKEIARMGGGGVVMMYNKETGTYDGPAPIFGKPLVLVNNWITESAISDSGFSEARRRCVHRRADPVRPGAVAARSSPRRSTLSASRAARR